MFFLFFERLPVGFPLFLVGVWCVCEFFHCFFVGFGRGGCENRYRLSGGASGSSWGSVVSAKTTKSIKKIVACGEPGS